MLSFFTKKKTSQQVKPVMVEASKCIKASEVFVTMYCLLSFIIVLNANTKYDKYAEDMTEESKREYLKFLLTLFFTSIVFFFFIWKYADNNLGWYVVLVNIVLMLVMLIVGHTVKMKTENKIFKGLVALSSILTLCVILMQMYMIQQKNPDAMAKLYQDVGKVTANTRRGFTRNNIDEKVKQKLQNRIQQGV